jgi:predicted nucleotidyltransferase
MSDTDPIYEADKDVEEPDPDEIPIRDRPLFRQPYDRVVQALPARAIIDDGKGRDLTAHSCLDGGGAVCHTMVRQDTMTEEMKGLVDKAASALKAAGAKEVYVFGSASKGKMRPDSDVDLAVSGLPPEVFFRAMGIASRALGRQVDLVDLDEDNPFTEYLKRHQELLRVG